MTVAEEQLAVADAQVLAATASASAAVQLYDTLEGQLTNAENLLSLFATMEQISNTYLTMATRLAWLAERAFVWETRRAGSYIAMNYASTTGFAKRFSGAAQLSTALDAMEHARITSETDRYQLLKTTFSLFAHNPAQLYALQQSRRCVFTLTQRQLDERFPGLYLHSLRRLEVEIDGLVPSTGVSAILKTSNNGKVRVPASVDYFTDASEVDSDWCYPEHEYPILDEETPPKFVLKPMLSNGFTMHLSEYRVSADGAVLSPPEGALDAFEHLPMDVIWVLELPATATTFDPANITDVRFVLYFTGQYDPELEQRQNEYWEADIVSRSTVFLASQHAASSLETFVNGPSDRRFRDVRLLMFDIGEDDLPKNIRPASRHPENVLFAFTQDGSTSMVVRFRGTIRPEPASVTVPYGDPSLPDGLVYSAVGSDDITIDAETYPSRLGDHPNLDAWIAAVDADSASPTNINGRYVLKVLPEDNASLCLKDNDGDYVDVTSGQLTFGQNGVSTYVGGSWKNARATVRAKITTGELWIRLRDASGSHVYAKVSTTQVVTGDSTGINQTYTRNYVVADEWTELTVVALGSSVSLYVDGVPTCTVSGVSVTAAGTLSITATGVGASIVVYDVRVRRLKYDGTELEEVVSDTYATSGAPGWTLAGSCTWSSTTHRTLDLSAINDVMFQLDFTGRYDIT